MGRSSSADTFSEVGTSTSSADFSGHLWRQGNSGRWRLQYFILKGTKLSWFMPTTRPHITSNKPLGSIQLDGALAEPIAIGCLSDMEGLGRVSMTTADAPAGIPPWGIAVEACGAGHGSHGAQRLVLAADSQKLRDLWLEVICQYEVIRESGAHLAAGVKHADRVVEDRAHSLSEWQQPQSQSFLSQAASASRSVGSPASAASSRPSSDDTAQRSQRQQRRQQHSSGCGQPRILRCFTGNSTRSLVLYNDAPPPSPYTLGATHRPSSGSSRQEAGFWHQVLGTGLDQNQGGETEAFALPPRLVSVGAQSEHLLPETSPLAVHDQGAAAATSEAAQQAELHTQTPEKSAPGWSIRNNDAFDSLSCQPDGSSCLGCGMGSASPPEPKLKGGWRVRDNASFDGASSQDPQGGEQAEPGQIPLPAFEGKKVGSLEEAGGVDPRWHSEAWLSSSMASGLSSAHGNSSRTSSSGLQPAGMAFVNASSTSSSGDSHSRGAGIGSMSSERAQVLLEQYQRLLTSVQSVRQHLQVPEQVTQPAGDSRGLSQLHTTGSSSMSGQGENLLRVQLGSLQLATGRMRDVLSRMQENRQMRRQQSRAQSCQQ